MNEKIVHNEQQHRFEVFVDDELAGFAAYEPADGARDFDHTEVGSEFGGRGLAGKVVAAALADTEAAGLSVVPTCSYVRKFVTKNAEHLAHIPAATRSAMGLPEPA
ncbi:GNAT family N-acetyltransferase [Tomitella fengzijianii]|uniref:N-acetyltransferase n=1 Tax=Tomitella fengzijianii TaxID=2597660 RepID=A0A516X172_9ACTN|nr:GNAT family N-acetyltransferase [Tomitella fengzijianii]QDQ96767.1 N-acetyltransferase [Tomitella fengzijianii]